MNQDINYSIVISFSTAGKDRIESEKTQSK
jgi:hypothetical protein